MCFYSLDCVALLFTLVHVSAVCQLLDQLTTRRCSVMEIKHYRTTETNLVSPFRDVPD